MAEIAVKVAGNQIETVLLSRVEVHQKLNHHWWSYIVCRGTLDQRIPVEDFIGQDLLITASDDEGEVVLLDGIVLEVQLKYEVWGSFTAKITGVTRSHKMDLTPRKAYYQEKTLDAIASQLAGNASLSATVNGPSKRPLNYVQWAETDFSFLRRLADDYGCWMRPTAQGLEISNQFGDAVDLTWRDEYGLIEFTTQGRLSQPSFNGAHYHHHEMKSQNYDQVKDEPSFLGSIGPLVGAVKNQSAKLPPGYVYQRSRVVTLDDYQQLLQKESVRSLGSAITASGRCSQPKLQPGLKVNVSGVLDSEGLYGITAVKHKWTPKTYINTFRCTPWQNYTNPRPPRMRHWYGLVPARVVEHNDPKKMGRIQVQYFWQQDGQAYWARMMTPHAGSTRGFMFMPEKGDEVVVGFEDGDPERPIILGCLWNGVDQAPRFDFAKDDIEPNDVKRIVTKSGNRLQMVDTAGKESITLSTPNSVKVMLVEANASPTKRETLVLQVDRGDIVLNAPQGRIHLHSQFYSREVGGMPAPPPPLPIPTKNAGALAGGVSVPPAGPSGPHIGPVGPGPLEQQGS
ncbi:MAG TPA: phage baseplate assembly protein V [Bryobacteraceae bacterium]|nr:phage baseplate assembly protein V [Bryobacteraceae bacterium]